MRSARRRRHASSAMAANAARIAATATTGSKGPSRACSVLLMRARAVSWIVATAARTPSIDALSCPVRMRAVAASIPVFRRASTTWLAKALLASTRPARRSVSCLSVPASLIAPSRAAAACS